MQESFSKPHKLEPAFLDFALLFAIAMERIYSIPPILLP
jgi:hypothetical protein